MLQILLNSNRDFYREVQKAIELIEEKQVPNELSPFKDWLISFYKNVEKGLENLFYYIQLKEPSIFPDIINETSKLQRQFWLANSKFLPSIYRYNDGDFLSLSILSWLHQNHKQTINKAFLITDGDFGILPSVDFPVTYYLPITSQHILLHSPLFFHELGHYLYEHHNNEMNDLVSEFQKKIEDYLTLPFQQNDTNYQNQLEKNKIIVETWYEWIQELFCDAVGLEIGGASYLKTFSSYLRMTGRSSFYVPEKELARRSHPVTWLRIKFICLRARLMGLISEAEILEKEWGLIAQTLSIKEEYYGYYSDQYKNDIMSTLNDMLVEASPIKWTDFNAPIQEYDPQRDNFIQLISLAWNKYQSNPNSYYSWEKSVISKIKASQSITREQAS